MTNEDALKLRAGDTIIFNAGSETHTRKVARVRVIVETEPDKNGGYYPLDPTQIKDTVKDNG